MDYRLRRFSKNYEQRYKILFINHRHDAGRSGKGAELSVLGSLANKESIILNFSVSLEDYKQLERDNELLVSISVFHKPIQIGDLVNVCVKQGNEEYITPAKINRIDGYNDRVEIGRLVA